MNRIFTSNWTDIYTHLWKKWLKDYIGKENIMGIEIGCYEGRSSCWFCENILTGKNSKLVCIDSWNYEPIENKFDNNVHGLNIRKIKKYSYIALAELIANENIFYDFIYIDGNHNGHFVLGDIFMGWKILKRGGIIICDDYLWTNKDVKVPPKIAIDSWLRCNIDKINGYEILYSKINCAQCAIWKKE